MSLTTRCPSCGTMFKVVPDQLRVSEGYVRCGHCAHVFDASSALVAPGGLPKQTASPKIGEPVPRPAPTAAPEPPVPDMWMRRPGMHPVLRHESRAEAESGDRMSEGFGAIAGETFNPVVPHDQADADSTPAPDHAVQPVFSRDVPSALLLQTADADEPQEALYQPAFSPPLAPADPSPDEDPLRDIGFVRTAERRAFWSRPAVVALMLLACLLLAALLGLQTVRQERDRIAAAAPALQPVLAGLCKPLRCTVGARRQIDAVAIEASAFNRRGADYQLSVELRSSAATPVAMPALELILTDAQDQTLLRRVLQPAEIKAPAVLPARGSWSGALPVRLLPDAAAGGSDASAVRVAGYRLLAFYP